MAAQTQTPTLDDLQGFIGNTPLTAAELRDEIANSANVVQESSF